MCRGNFPQTEDIPETIFLNGGSLEVVRKFYYLGDMPEAVRGLAPLLEYSVPNTSLETCCLSWDRMPPPLKAKIELYKACVQKCMLYDCETYPANLEDG